MPLFTVRIDANAGRQPAPSELASLREALTDFHGRPDTGTTPARWSVTLVISAGTIEDAARDGVELVIEAANAVGMPESDIATLVVTSASEQYRRNTAADHPSG